MKKVLSMALMAAMPMNFSDGLRGREYRPYPNPANSNAARHKREAKKRANIRARSPK